MGTTACKCAPGTVKGNTLAMRSYKGKLIVLGKTMQADQKLSISICVCKMIDRAKPFALTEAKIRILHLAN